MLAQHFAANMPQPTACPSRPLVARRLTRAATHAWPGNVRELENTMHRAVLLATGTDIDADAIRMPVARDGACRPAARRERQRRRPRRPHRRRRRARPDHRHARHCFGNRTHAASILGISIRTLRNKLNQYSGDGVAVPAASVRPGASLASV